MISMRSGSVAIQALLAGEIQFAASGTSSGVEARMAGADIVSIAEYIPTLPYTVVVSPRIKTANDLKGKRFAVSRLGAISDIALRIALEKLGIDPKKEAVILGLGDVAARFSALKAGTIDGTIIIPPETLTARKMGFRPVLSFQEAGVQFAFGSIFIAKDFGQKHPDVVLNFLKGFTEAIAYIRTNREGSLKILSKWTRNEDREALDEAYGFFVNLYPKKPYSSDDGMNALITVMRERNPAVTKFNARELNNMDYLRQLDKTGFIDNLYQ
jgi:NitT/TauT family transport system substrate-binding protein